VTEKICPSCHRPVPSDAPGGLCPVCVLLAAREDVPPTDIPSLEEVRAAFPQFEILELIGRGGMGVVYKARQPQLDRTVALKILLPGLHHDPGFAERFSREARALAKLAHPNIVGVHDFGESGGFFWLSMEHVDGVNLRQAMQAARFTPEQALAIIPDLCSALQYAHDHGVLHRDIKPENILLDAKGRVKVADFGIARMADDERRDFTLTMTGSTLGSRAYIAPEQIENPGKVDHRADLYSLGVVFYEMLTGELPLGRFPAPSEKSGSDPRLDEVVFRTLEKEREKRYQSAAEVKADVETASERPKAPGPKALSGQPLHLIAWAIGLFLGGATVLGVAAAGESILLAALGGCATVLGLAAAWWVLWRMKTGAMPLAGRPVLMAIAVWLPAILISGALALLVANEPPKLFYGKGDHFAGLMVVYPLSFMIGLPLFLMSALPDTKQASRGRRRIAAGLSIAMAAVALVGAKRLEGRADLYEGFSVVQLRGNPNDLGSRSMTPDMDARIEISTLENSLLTAARNYSPGVKVEQIRGTSLWKISFTTRNAAEFADHWRAFYQRFGAILPPEFKAEENVILHEENAGAYVERMDFLPRLGTLLAAGLAGVFAAFALFPMAWLPLAAAVAGVLAMLAAPMWRSIPHPEGLVDGPPLPPLEGVNPPADPGPGSPEAAIKSMLKAAAEGDGNTFRKGMSLSLADMLKREGDDLTEPLRDFSRVTFKAVREQTRDTAQVVLEREDDPGREVIFQMIFEDGGWRLTEQGH
jgi:tRNA A-37 threonylcarbamoyl transferase component Bud32